jgi:hypothetical protein
VSTALAFGQKGLNPGRGGEAIAVPIDRSRNNGVGRFLAKPFGLRRLFGKF